MHNRAELKRSSAVQYFLPFLSVVVLLVRCCWCCWGSSAAGKSSGERRTRVNLLKEALDACSCSCCRCSDAAGQAGGVAWAGERRREAEAGCDMLLLLLFVVPAVAHVSEAILLKGKGRGMYRVLLKAEQAAWGLLLHCSDSSNSNSSTSRKAAKTQQRDRIVKSLI